MEIEDYFSLGRFAHRDLWKPEEPVWSPLHLLNDYLKKQTFRIEIKVPAGVHLERPELIAIGPGTVIEPGVYIQGPCIIGAGCILRHGAYLRGGVILGSRAAVGIRPKSSTRSFSTRQRRPISPMSEIRLWGVGRTWERESNARICGSIGKKWLWLESRLVWKKFGAVIGDRVQIGCNCVLESGHSCGKREHCLSASHFGGEIPPRSKSPVRKKSLRSLLSWRKLVLLEPYRRKVEEELPGAIERFGEKSRLRDACQYALLSNGKKAPPFDRHDDG